MRGILVGFALSLVLINSASALVGIEPSPGSLSIFSDMYFVVNATISGVDEVYGFQFDLTYDPSIFEISGGSDVYKGTFLNRNGQDDDYCVSPDISTPGLIDNFACSRVGLGSVSGTGVLAGIKFKLKPLTTLPSTSDIVLSEVKISDRDSQPLDNSTEDGNATVYECMEGETRSCIMSDREGTRTCNSNNQWGVCYVPPSGPGPGGSPGPVNGGYPEPPNETDDNGEDGDGEEPFPSGDINVDGCADIQDLALVGANFGLGSVDPGFDSRADANGDGEADIVDLVLVAIDFGSGPNC